MMGSLQQICVVVYVNTENIFSIQWPTTSIFPITGGQTALLAVYLARRGEVLMFSRIPIFLCHNNNKAIWLFLLEWAASSAPPSHPITSLPSPPARYQDGTFSIAMPVTWEVTREGRHWPSGTLCLWTTLCLDKWPVVTNCRNLT